MNQESPVSTVDTIACDEFSSMPVAPARASISDGFDEDRFYVIWTPSYRCNFTCSYCAAQKGRANKSNFPLELIEPTLEYLAGINKKRYTFTITGGEISLYPHLHSLLQGIGRHFDFKNTGITLLHNGSADTEWMQSVIDAAAPVTVLIAISLHFGQIDMNTLVQKILSFPEHLRNKHFYIKLLPPPGKLAEATQVKQLFDEAGITNYRVFFVRNLQNNTPDVAYSPEELHTIRNWIAEKPVIEHMVTHEYNNGPSHTWTFNDGITRDVFRYKGMLCTAGFNSCNITPSGVVTQAGICGNLHLNLADGNPFANSDFFRPHVCEKERCICAPYCFLQKWSDPAHAPAFVKKCFQPLN